MRGKQVHWATSRPRNGRNFKVHVALVHRLIAELAGTAILCASSVSLGQAVLAEALGAFILVTAVFALASTPHGVHGFGIGLALATQIMVFGPLTGASVNLARTLGPDVMLSLAGTSVAWSQLFVYLVSPLIGGLVATFLHDLVTRHVSARTVTTKQT